jgi:hypothetical protein
MGLRQLIYMSTLTEGFQNELPSILASAVKNNASCGLTGMLLYADGNILQVLEGEEADLAAMYQRIERDPRHFGIFVLTDEKTSSRQFAAWSMGYRVLSAAELAAFPISEQLFKSNLSEIEQRVLPSAALTVLKTFADESVVLRM